MFELPELLLRHWKRLLALPLELEMYGTLPCRRWSGFRQCGAGIAGNWVSPMHISDDPLQVGNHGVKVFHPEYDHHVRPA